MISSLQNMLKSSNDYLELKVANLSDVQKNVATVALAIFAIGIVILIYKHSNKLYNYVFKRLEPADKIEKKEEIKPVEKTYPIIDGLKKGKLTLGEKVFDMDGHGFWIDNGGYLNGNGTITYNSCQLRGDFRNGKLQRGSVQFLKEGTFWAGDVTNYKVKHIMSYPKVNGHVNFGRTTLVNKQDHDKLKSDAIKWLDETNPFHSAKTQGPTTFTGEIRGGITYKPFSKNTCSLSLNAKAVTIDALGNLNGECIVISALWDKFKGTFKEGKMTDGKFTIHELNDHQYEVTIKENKIIQVTEDTLNLDMSQTQDPKISNLTLQILNRWSYTTSTANPPEEGLYPPYQRGFDSDFF